MKYYKLILCKNFFLIFILSGLAFTAYSQKKNPITQFILTSDNLFGSKRASFQGKKDIAASEVNEAMIKKMNTISALTLPKDDGINADQSVGGIDFIVNAGDITNRIDESYQTTTDSWVEFKKYFIDSLNLKNNAGQKSKLYLLPGNFDVSNAIGSYNRTNKDSSAMVNMYNMMMQSARPEGKYNYKKEKIHYSKNIVGIHCMFICIWPDSAERAWMEHDLKKVSTSTPVFIFTHDQPEVESKHFTKANNAYLVNSIDKFDSVLSETFKDGKTVSTPSTIEQNGFCTFLLDHPNIVAYFHGNEYESKFNIYTGPENRVVLPVFGVDSPIKDRVKGTPERHLSFILVTIDTLNQKMTVRECLWNSKPNEPNSPLKILAGKTIDFNVENMKEARIAMLNDIKSLEEKDYTVPSWTIYKRTQFNALKDKASLAKLKEAKANLVSKNVPYDINIRINGNPQTRMAFAWFTNFAVNAGKVQLIEGNVPDEAAFNNPKYIFGASCEHVKGLNYNVAGNVLKNEGIPDNTLKSYVSNKALATGLKPNTNYSYRVGNTNAWSPIGKFKTAPSTKEPFSFIYFTDPQANTDEMFTISQKTTHSAQKMYPKANFWLSCGDLIQTENDPHSEWEMEQFFETQQDIFLNNPFVSVAGNHDQSTSKNYSYHFYPDPVLFDAKMAIVPGSVYSFVYGDALFMALNYEDYSTPGYLDSLSVWMKRQVIANPDVKWRIAFYHKTMFTGSGSHQSDRDGKLVRMKMTPVFDSLKIDLALQGHDHIYEVMGPIKNRALVNDAVTGQTNVDRTKRDNVTGKFGGTFNVKEGTLYFLNNSAGKKKYEPRDSIAMMDARTDTLGIVTNYFQLFTGKFGQTGEPTFSNITISTDSIKISTYTVNNIGEAKLFDEFKIIK